MPELERLTILKNIAANGRTFCTSLCAICIAVFLVKQDTSFVALAVLAVWPLAISYIVELAAVSGWERPRGFLWFAMTANVVYALFVLFKLATI